MLSSSVTNFIYQRIVAGFNKVHITLKARNG